MRLDTRIIDADAYRPYGDLIVPRGDCATVDVNLGTAVRYLQVAAVENLRRGDATPNLSVYRCQPWSVPLHIETLERHRYSTQIFLPMSDTARFLIVVALGENEPDLDSCIAFDVRGAVGISYRPGVWHHPMIAIERPTDFWCVVCENGSAEDCQESHLNSPIRIHTLA